MIRPTLLLIASASFASSCGRGPVDAMEAIALVPTDEWRADETQAIVQAGDAWNIEFGTQLRMESDHEPQAITIRLEEDGCMNGSFQRTHARTTIEPPEIVVCPETAADPLLLFETVRHELGHALGIRKHARDPSAVMTALATQQSHSFQAEDRTLFFSANPGFSPRAD